jgi:uncharacterized protein
MPNPHQTYEVRCPIHGFVSLNDWEWTVISQPAFQRLRRIRQLAWTDYVYPGAMHTRFEHSLGVMHTATLLYDAIQKTSSDILKADLAYDEAGLKRDRQLVRFAALLHDLGHSPFSHGSEQLFPSQKGSKKYAHEDYSVAVIKICLRDAIQNHALNANYGFRAEDVAALIEGSASAKQSVFWRDLINGQMDADRMDYLLRDSFHAGVQYGRFDLSRLISTIRAIPGAEGHPPRLGITEGGVHATEALVLARYFMFTQVYFHKTRVAYDIHLREALKELLPGGKFPKPTTEKELKQYLDWDDWKVLGLLKKNLGGPHAQRLLTRNHYRRVYHTPEVSSHKDLDKLDRVRKILGRLRVAEEAASKSWYKTGKLDVPVISDIDVQKVSPLSKHSKVVGNLKANNQVFLYVKPENVSKAQKALKKVI